LEEVRAPSSQGFFGHLGLRTKSDQLFHVAPMGIQLGLVRGLW